MAFTTFTICNAAPVFSLSLCYTVLYCIIYYILYIKYFLCITQNTRTYVCTTSVSSQTSPVLQTYPSSPSPTNQDSVLLKLNSSSFFAFSLVFLIPLTGTIRSFLDLWVCWFHFLGALTSVLSPGFLVCFLFRLLQEPPQLFCFQSSAPLTFCVAYRMLFLRHDCVSVPTGPFCALLSPAQFLETGLCGLLCPLASDWVWQVRGTDGRAGESSPWNSGRACIPLDYCPLGSGNNGSSLCHFRPMDVEGFLLLLVPWNFTVPCR